MTLPPASFRAASNYRPHLIACAIWVSGAMAACGGSSEPTDPSAGSSHAITIDVALYNATVDNPILEASLLLDGIQVGTSTKYSGGTGSAHFSPLPIAVSSGTHRVAIKVIQQRFPSVTYQVLGTALGSNDKTGALVRQDFPASATLKAGDVVEVTVNVP